MNHSGLAAWRAQLHDVLGSDAVLEDIESRELAAASWHPIDLYRRAAGIRPANPLPIAVLRPNRIEDIPTVCRACRSAAIAVVPVGGKSNLTGANDFSPSSTYADAAALDLSHCREISLDEESLLVRVDAGMTLGELEETLNRHGYTLGVLPGSANLATVGGSIATNAIGSFSGRYGRFSDIVAGVTLVLPDGKVFTTPDAPQGGLPRADLARLVCGSEGRFGIVSSASLRIRPIAEARAWAGFVFTRFRDAVDATRLIYRTDASPALLIVLEKAGAPSDVAIPDAGALLLFAVEGDELVQTGVFQLAYAICENTGGTALSPDTAETAWNRTDQARASRNGRAGHLSDTVTLWSSWKQLKSMHELVTSSLRRYESVRFFCQLCHPDGQGASLEVHWNSVVEPTDVIVAEDLFVSVTESICGSATAEGGLVAHHYGVGRARRIAETLEREPAEQMLYNRLSDILLAP